MISRVYRSSLFSNNLLLPITDQTALPDRQPSTVAFSVLAQLCGPMANETEVGVALFTKMVRAGTLTFYFILDLAKTCMNYKGKS